MSTGFSEADVEQSALHWFGELGYATLPGRQIAPEGPKSERTHYGDVVLAERFRDALARINPHIPAETREDALKRVMTAETLSLVEENRRLHQALVEGIDVEFYGEDGTIRGDKVYLVDFDNPDNNDWLAVNQFTVIEDKNDRRPDVVVFVNGLALAVIELKNPGSQKATLESAHDQLQVYKAQIPSLFRSNAVLVTSDGLLARMGSLTADVERFMPWRTVNGKDIAPKGVLELGTLIEGVFEKGRFLEYIRSFIVFGNDGSRLVKKNDGSRLIKKIAGYHQFHAVRHAVDCTVAASAIEGDRKVGVIWHTQGSGKSLLMAFYAGRIATHPHMENPTLVVITDRNDLDDQLFGTFSGCADLIRQKPQQADSREALVRLLSVPSGGVIFTTIQKFTPEQDKETYPQLTDRRNVIVIVDEAHRSQYGFKARVAEDTGDITYGFAKHLRDGLPNASFIGFTGTPIEATDVNTPAVFGDYIDIYDIQRGVEDGATVPIYYESRLARIELDQDKAEELDARVDAITEDEPDDETEKMKGQWSRVEELVGNEKRLAIVARDMVEHFESRTDAMDGKAMVVCMSRRICVELYQHIIALRPEWHSEDDEKGTLKVVMTGSATDPPEWQQHIGAKRRREDLAKRMKNPDDPMKIVLVRDMWLTGFDAPCLHTMYVDKPMRGHGLMQAIARVNRVFRDKPGGLVVDYIGLTQNLKNALAQYSDRDREQTGIDEGEAVALMIECYEIVRDMYHGFDYARALSGTSTSNERLNTLGQAMEWIRNQQYADAAKTDDEDKKKQAWRRYADAVLALSKAFALAAASDPAKDIRDEVGFFQTVNAALQKSGGGTDKKSNRAAFDAAIRQVVDGAIAAPGIIDILDAVGVNSPDMSVLSDQFLNDVRGMKQKNLALEALRELLNGEIKSRFRNNVVQYKAFSERLQSAINRYHSNAITTVQVIEETIEVAKDLRAKHARGEESGLTAEEIAFYDALADNKSAVDVLGDKQLRVIAHKLMERVRASTTIDWQHNQNARARIRVIVKKILKEFGYPPNLQDAAVQLVLQQAEALSHDLTKQAV